MSPLLKTRTASWHQPNATAYHSLLRNKNMGCFYKTVICVFRYYSGFYEGELLLNRVIVSSVSILHQANVYWWKTMLSRIRNKYSLPPQIDSKWPKEVLNTSISFGSEFTPWKISLFLLNLSQWFLDFNWPSSIFKNQIGVISFDGIPNYSFFFFS